MLTVEMRGLNELLEYISRLPDVIVEGAKEGLRNAAVVIAEYTKRFVPVDTGDLISTVRVEIVDDFTVRVVVGNDYIDYALTVHESTWNVHHVGQAKYSRNTSDRS